ncbi:hypothetical protein [Parabacteroides sp. PF5-9]|uniref:hypothetical protein n=1 Tax=Parabacteroides sp. PF5-9 TaxID=1742404 RepID=UPI002476447A|nr:hypothetical protein [Parabacteroides sp. PF5-9]
MYRVLTKFNDNADAIIRRAFDDEQEKEAGDPTALEIIKLIADTIEAANSLSSDVLKRYRTMPFDKDKFLEKEAKEWYDAAVNNPTGYQYLEQNISLDDMYDTLWGWWNNKERLHLARRGLVSLIVYRKLVEKEGKPKGKPNKKEPLFQDYFVSKQAYLKAVKWLESNNHINNNGVFIHDARDFTLFILTLKHQGWLTKDPKASFIEKIMDNYSLRMSERQIRNIIKDNKEADLTNKSFNPHFFNFPSISEISETEK